MTRYREKLLVLMEILGALREGPMVPNRLSQMCNLNYQRMIEMLDQLKKRGLVTSSMESGHELYSLTPDGLKVSMNYQWVNSMIMGDAPDSK